MIVNRDALLTYCLHVSLENKRACGTVVPSLQTHGLFHLMFHQHISFFLTSSTFYFRITPTDLNMDSARQIDIDPRGDVILICGDPVEQDQQ